MTRSNEDHICSGSRSREPDVRCSTIFPDRPTVLQALIHEVVRAWTATLLHLLTASNEKVAVAPALRKAQIDT